MRAYDIPLGQIGTALGYQPRLIAKRIRRAEWNYFQIRTKTSVNMTARYRHNIAVMGGACALFAAIMRNSSMVASLKTAMPRGYTYKSYVMPYLIEGLKAKGSNISIGGVFDIVNPWQSSETPNAPIPASVKQKFADELEN